MVCSALAPRRLRRLSPPSAGMAGAPPPGPPLLSVRSFQHQQNNQFCWAGRTPPNKILFCRVGFPGAPPVRPSPPLAAGPAAAGCPSWSLPVLPGSRPSRGGRAPGRMRARYARPPPLAFGLPPQGGAQYQPTTPPVKGQDERPTVGLWAALDGVRGGW